MLRISWFFIPLIVILVLIFMFPGTATPVITCAPVRVEVSDTRGIVWINSAWQSDGDTLRAVKAPVIQTKPPKQTVIFSAPPFPVNFDSGIVLTGLLIGGGVKTLRLLGPGGEPEILFELEKSNSVANKNTVTVSVDTAQTAAAESPAPAFANISIIFDRLRCQNRS